MAMLPRATSARCLRSCRRFLAAPFRYALTGKPTAFSESLTALSFVGSVPFARATTSWNIIYFKEMFAVCVVGSVVVAKKCNPSMKDRDFSIRLPLVIRKIQLLETYSRRDGRFGHLKALFEVTEVRQYCGDALRHSSESLVQVTPKNILNMDLDFHMNGGIFKILVRYRVGNGLCE